MCPDLAGTTTVQAEVPAQSIVVRPEQASLPPTTTRQEDRVYEGQRWINRLWEVTQSVLTVLITCAMIYNAIHKVESKTVEYAFIAVVSTYYARTNHTKQGGVFMGDSGR